MKIFWTLLVYFSILSCSDQSNLKNRLIQLEETRIDNIQYLMNKHRVDSVKAIFVKGSLDYLMENQVAEFYYSQGDSVWMIENMSFGGNNTINVYEDNLVKKEGIRRGVECNFKYIQNVNFLSREEKVYFGKSKTNTDTSYFYFENDFLIKSKLRNEIISTYSYYKFGKLDMRRDSIISEKLLLNFSDTIISTRFRYNSNNKLISSVKSHGDNQTIVTYDSLGFPIEKYYFSDLDTIYCLKYKIY
ncbi:MAG: hypothetical protein ACPGSD_03620 [Flavobacteriales bacterium]